MAVIETWLRQDLKGLVSVRSLQGQVFSLDNGGNLIGVKVTKDGQPVTLTGTVTGYCILSDGQTVTVTGSGKSGIQNVNEAYIVLPQLVYSVPGQISIVIKLTSGSVTTTLAACTGYVYRSRTSNEVVPPGTPIPDLATMEEVIRRATAATDAATAATVGAEKVDASMTKEGDVITIAVTDRDGNVTEKTVTDQTEAMKRKADIDGYYEELAVGTADQLASTEAVTDTTPYLYRKSGGSVDIGNRETLEKIVGGTVAWNQRVNKTSLSGKTVNGVTVTADTTTGKLTVSGTATADAQLDFIPSVIPGAPGHIMYLYQPDGASQSTFFVRSGDDGFWNYKTVGVWYGAGLTNLRVLVKSGQTVNITFAPQLFDLTAMFGPTIADYIYNLEQANAGAGVAWFRKLFPKDYYSYNTGELISVKPSSHDMVGFNLWDEKWENGSYGNDGSPSADNSRIRSKNKIKIIPGATYFLNVNTAKYAAGTWVHIVYFDDGGNVVGNANPLNQATFNVPSNATHMLFNTSSGWGSGTTYNHDICINLSHSGSRNGEYEPYEKHSYPLADVELRGPLGIDADGKLVYSGDEYTPDGQVKRKYGVVDLGTLNPYKYADGVFAYHISVPTTGNVLCNRYETAWNHPAPMALPDKNITTTNAIGDYYPVVVRDNSYTDAAAFKTAMSGVMLLYELATPTTEQVDPYTAVQVVDDWGTEEFVDTREVAIPVGHSTSYMANLRDKLQHLPSLADEDGEYIVKQTGTKMELSKLSSSGLAQGIFVETESAPVVSFADGADGQAMKAVNVAIEPVQDLHGYDAPWPAGGNVNLFKYTDTDKSTSNNGVACTINAETEKFTISGTNSKTDAAWLLLSGSPAYVPAFASGETYVFSHNLSDKAYAQLVYTKTGGVQGVLAYLAGGGTGEVKFTVPNDYASFYRFQIGIYARTTSISEVATFEISKSSTAPTEWTPYSNICPISGWTGAKVTRTGKNLLPNAWESGTIGISAGKFVLVENANRYRQTGIAVPAGEYAASVGGNLTKFVLYKYNKDTLVATTIRQMTATGTSVSFSVSENELLAIAIDKAEVADITAVPCQLELGSTATAYEPYQGQTYEVTFPSEAGTVYGGTLDVVSGKLVVDKVIALLDDASLWTSSTSLTTPYIYNRNFNDRKLFNNSYTGLLCSAMPVDETRQNYTARWSGATSKTFGIKTENPAISLDVFKDLSSRGELSISYLLATPQTYQLSPTEIKTLLGANNIWADAGNTAVTYPADTKLYIDNKIAELQALILENNG